MPGTSFTKMHGAGNDFVMIEDMDEVFPLSQKLVAALCAQHTGVGADGLILVQPAEREDFRMRYFNRDGGEAEMCGNGARCTARFASIAGIAGDTMIFQTGAGPVKAQLIGPEVRIDISDVTGLRLGIRSTRDSLLMGYAICGVPHAVHVVDDIDLWDRKGFEEMGRAVRLDPMFAPEGTNFNMVTIRDRMKIRFRTYERGVEAETLACGTGAVAIAAVCSALGLIDAPVSCETSSGDILRVGLVPVETGATDCSLQGPAVVSFTGEFDLDAFAG